MQYPAMEDVEDAVLDVWLLGEELGELLCPLLCEELGELLGELLGALDPAEDVEDAHGQSSWSALCGGITSV